MTDLVTLIECVHQHQVIAYPTEAVFGLGCDPKSESAVLKLLSLKKRSIEKGLILVAHNIELLVPFIDEKQLSPLQWQQLIQVYDRPITWVVPAQKNVPYFLTGCFSSIAVRLCQHEAVIQLCEILRYPLTSTSANLSGLPPCRNVAEVKAQFGNNFPVFEGEVGGEQNPSQIRDILTQSIIR